jgi:hypothetical protein
LVLSALTVLPAGPNSRKTGDRQLLKTIAAAEEFHREAGVQ